MQKPVHRLANAGTVHGFEVNRGQSDPRVKFLSLRKGYAVFLTREEAVLSLASDGDRDHSGSALRLRFVGASPEPTWTGLDPLPGLSHYFIGNDPSRWITHVPSFAKVRLQEIYRGVDVVFYEGPGGLEYDFTLSPHADPGQVGMCFPGARSVELDSEGALVLRTDGGAAVRMLRPVAYQTERDVRHVIDARYALEANGNVRFQLAPYDKSQPLIIDPVLTYSTYLGGSGNDNAAAIATDASGNVYVTGSTTSADFPLANPFKGVKPGMQNVFVAKLNAAGSSYVYSTYIGGSGTDLGTGIAVDASGYVAITGATTSTDFPVVNALRPTLAGVRNAFVLKLNAAGSGLVYSTYLGGSGSDQGFGIAMDSAGNAYVTGAAGSTNFPMFNPLQPASAGPANGSDAFATKINPAGTAYIYSTYLGGSGSDTGRAIAVDSAGNAYVTGDTGSKDFPRANALQPTLAGGIDTFIAKINAAGSALVYSTYLGGSGNDTGRGIALDRTGNAYVTGATASPDFPLANALQSALAGGSDAFAAKVNAGGSALAYSTYLGGNGDDFGLGIAVDGAGNAYLTGVTSSVNFPIVNAVQATRGGGRDAFVMELGMDGSNMFWSTYLGGTSDDAGAAIAADIAGNVYLAGATSSNDFPTALAVQPASGGGQDAFIARIVFPQNLVPAASLSASNLIFGSQFVGRASSAQTVTLTNSGAALLAILSVTASGDFRQTNTCGPVLAPGANCAISIAFNPTLAGARTGAVTITDNAGGTPHIISLSGTAVAPVPQISLSTVTAKPGGAGFTLKVNGSGFVPGAVVNWNGSPRQTTYISTTQLNAAILASDIAGAGTPTITV
ncbi:MAG TPA: SBBP repeat-containing protein, partial [Bryobacteraceae bacterium]|nr:SBBP repeat-containing protein [Bryobacteraceae bacterium]